MEVNQILSFLSIPLYLNEDKLEELLNNYNLNINQVILFLINQKKINILIDFINKIILYSNGIYLLFHENSIEILFNYISSSPSSQSSSSSSSNNNQKLIICIIEILLSLNNIQNLNENILLKVLQFSLNWITNENMKISDGGSTILYNIAIINESYCEKVVEEIIKQIQKEEISADTTIQMRYLGIISNIHSSGDERYSTICIKHGATDAIMKACEIPDILVQMITLEYIPNIMLTNIGIDYLITSLVLNPTNLSIQPLTHLEWLLLSSSNEGDDYLRAQCLLCTAKLLSTLEKINHSFCNSVEFKYQTKIVPLFLSYISNVLESLTESDRLAAILSLTTFATSSPSAYKNTLSNPNLLIAWLSLLRSQPSIQGPVLHSIAQILLYPKVLLNDDEITRNQTNLMITNPSNDINKQFSSIFLSLLSKTNENTESSINSIIDSLHAFKKNLFDMIGSYVGRFTTIEYLLKCVKQPIIEVKKGATDILRSLAYQNNIWGLELLMSNIQFYNYLKDRTTEYSKEEKEWKFSLIIAIYFSPNSHLLSDEIKSILREMILQGPYYMPPRLEEPVTEEKGSS